jgi:DNA-binding LacI/PurR family transcriptional regulator
VFIGTRPTAVRTDYVDIDNVATARQATEELIRAGHRDILHLAGPLDVNSAARDRRDGYVAALRAAGLPVRENLIIDCSFNGDFVDPRLSAAMDGGLRFSAVFAANYSMARAASASLAKRGLRIPADVSLITIDADDTLRNEIRTFAQPLEGIGGEAGRLLLERMTGTGGPPRSVFMPCQLSGAATVAPPR